MAENKITHAGVLKLPEPEWLTLKALAERWTSMSGEAYDIDKLLDLAVQRRLQISLYCPLVIPHIRKPRIKMTEGQYRTVQYRTKLGIPDWGVFGISPFDIERLQHLKKGEDFVLHSVLPNSVLTFDSENSSVVFVPTADNPPRVKNLIVTREEIERFEQRYFESEEPAVQSDTAPSLDAMTAEQRRAQWEAMPPQQRRASWEAMTPEQRLAQWEAMSTEQKGVNASARYAVLETYGAVACELGINPKTGNHYTHKTAEIHVKAHKKRMEEASNKKVGDSISAELLRMAQPTKQGKSRG